MKKIVAVCFVLFSGLLTSCNEEIEVSPLQIASNDVIAPIPPYPFDFDNAEFMPTPAGQELGVPWSNGVNLLYDPVIRYDYKSIDGWKLLYNTFRPTVPPNGQFFALYNKYRGILRYYEYIGPNSHTQSTYMEDEVYAFGSSSTSFFNFVGKEVIDPANITTKSQQMIPIPVPSEGGWFVSQHEVAYDPNLHNLTNQNVGLYQNLKFWNITSTTLSGSINGSAGNLQNPSSPWSNLFSSAAQLGVSYLALQGTWSTNITNGLNSLQSNGAKGIAGSVASLITSSLFGGGSQAMNFTVELNAELDGANSSVGSIKSNYTIALPGTSNATSANGPVPADNDPLGVFNFTSRPTVMIKNFPLPSPIQCLAPYGMSTSPYEYTFYLNNDFLKKLIPQNNPNIYNPEFLEVARIYQGNSYYWTGGGAPGPRIELLVGTNNWQCPNGVQIVGPKTGCAYLENVNIAGTQMKVIKPARNGASSEIVGNGMFKSTTPVYLRIYLDVIPKNGSPKTTIVKTFKCNVSSWI